MSQMNLQLHNVISDITGETGMKIIARHCQKENVIQNY